MLKLRRFEASPENYEAMATVYVNALPDSASTGEELAQWDSFRDPKYEWERWLGYLGDELAFYGDVRHSEQTHRKGRREIAYYGDKKHVYSIEEKEFCYHLLRRAIDHDPFEIITILHSDQKSYKDFVEENGFEFQQYDRISALNLKNFDTELWQACIDALAEREIELICYSDMDESSLPRMYELASRILSDVPLPDEHTMESFESYAHRLKTMSYDHRLRWYAVCKGEFVGQTVIIDNKANPKLGQTGLTGVVKEYRRAGVARALKARCLIAAKEMGIETIQTENEENNPMFKLNEELGFVEKFSWLQYGKSFREPTEEDLRQD